MSVADWNFLAGRLTGDGHIEVVESELPINISDISRNLSAPSMMSGQITNQVQRLRANGRPVLEPWNTVIIAEAAGLIRGMTIYRRPTFEGAVWTLDQVGLSGYAQGMPYDGARGFTAEDPLNIFRHIWEHLQSWPNGNLGITIDPTTSPIRVGTVDEPYLLNHWETKDLGQKVDSLSSETPFDWLEKTSWLNDEPHCHIALGYPTIGGRKEHMRLVLGENLADVPSVTAGDFANEAWVYGAGEGRARVRGRFGVTDGKIRRIVVAEDENLTNTDAANIVARNLFNETRGQIVVESVEVFDHPNAPLEAIELGDELPLYAETDWIEVDQYARVIGKSESPQKGDRATLTLMRTVQA